MTSTVSMTATPTLEVAMLDAACARPGARVLDVGCGRGDVTLDAARRVGPSGLVLGVDTRLAMLEDARHRAAQAGLGYVGFVYGDTQTQRFLPLRFDVIVSARGLGVFTDVDAGIANLTGALRAGGRLALLAPDDPAEARAALDRAGLVGSVAGATGVVTASAAL